MRDDAPAARITTPSNVGFFAVILNNRRDCALRCPGYDLDNHGRAALLRGHHARNFFITKSPFVYQPHSLIF
jgi:hypothetical protein